MAMSASSSHLQPYMELPAALPKPGGPGNPLLSIPVILNITSGHVSNAKYGPTPELPNKKLREWSQQYVS